MNIEDLAKIQIAEEGLEIAIAGHLVFARYQIGQFNNYVKAGFTEEQALFLVAENNKENNKGTSNE